MQPDKPGQAPSAALPACGASVAVDCTRNPVMTCAPCHTIELACPTADPVKCNGDYTLPPNGCPTINICTCPNSPCKSVAPNWTCHPCPTQEISCQPCPTVDKSCQPCPTVSDKTCPPTKIPEFCPTPGFACGVTQDPRACQSAPGQVCGTHAPPCNNTKACTPEPPLRGDPLTAAYWRGPRTGVFNPYGR
ncbi:MAG: hypothetical protein QOJ39_433 [Candidatus Eremiobacteraeota bacterium]|jgi:hypothetical protein|nr:hypothetical protein [Candidatus Eremiobacteraeota bacterium]